MTGNPRRMPTEEFLKLHGWTATRPGFGGRVDLEGREIDRYKSIGFERESEKSTSDDGFLRALNAHLRGGKVRDIWSSGHRRVAVHWNTGEHRVLDALHKNSWPKKTE
ncbi:MAG: hypothetical protein V1708_00855 [Candidatus Micrarchaeota archaeon]